MVAADVDTGFSRPRVGRQAMQRVAVGEADDLTVMFENEPFVGLLGRGDTRSHLLCARDFDFPTDHRVLDIGAVNRNAGGRILEGSRTHTIANRLHASSLPAAGGFAWVGPVACS